LLLFIYEQRNYSLVRLRNASCDVFVVADDSQCVNPALIRKVSEDAEEAFCSAVDTAVVSTTASFVISIRVFSSCSKFANPDKPVEQGGLEAVV
jgi:hypothetical protein